MSIRVIVKNIYYKNCPIKLKRTNQLEQLTLSIEITINSFHLKVVN